MLKKLVLTSLLAPLGLLATPLSSSLENKAATGKSSSSTLFSQDGDSPIIVNNRILIRIDDSPISLMDVVKRMDLVFYQHFPQFANSPQMRLKFYQVNWQDFFNSLVEEKLFLIEAKEKGLIVHEGDVREELERKFGPDVVGNIDKAGLSFEEAWSMIRDELVVQRLSYIMVHMKAMRDISPQLIKQYYEDNQELYKTPKELSYEVLTVKSPDELDCAHYATKAFERTKKDELPLQQVKSELDLESQGKINIKVSELLNRKEKDISKSHLDILQKLQPGECSLPVITTRKQGESKLHLQKIFHLKEAKEEGVQPLKEVEASISQELMSKEIASASQTYTDSLKKKFGVEKNILQETIPDNFVPFSL